MMRLFFAFLPPPELIAHVNALNVAKTLQSLSIRWIPPQQWHLTLFFIGEMEAIRLPSLLESTRELFEVKSMWFHHPVLSFGPPHSWKKRLFWIQFDPHPTFTDLAWNVYHKVAQVWNRVEKPKPLPHVTLGRMKPQFVNTSLPNSLQSQYLFSGPVLFSSVYSPKLNTHVYHQIFPKPESHNMTKKPTSNGGNSG